MADLRKTARGQPCHLRLPGHCNRDSSTVVLAHFRAAGLAGVGMKAPDVCGVFACSACHDILDGRRPAPPEIADDLWRWVLEGHLRTLDFWWSTGAIKT